MAKMDKIKFLSDVIINGNLKVTGTNTAEVAEQILTKGALTVINSENELLETTLMGTVIRTGRTGQAVTLKPDFPTDDYYAIGGDVGHSLSGNMISSNYHEDYIGKFYQYYIPLSMIPEGATFMLSAASVPAGSRAQTASTWLGIVDFDSIVRAREENWLNLSETPITYDPTTLLNQIPIEDRFRHDYHLYISASEVILNSNEYVDYAIIYDPLNEAVRLGVGTYNDSTNTFAFTKGEGYPIAVRDLKEDEDGHLVYWDAQNYCLKGSPFQITLDKIINTATGIVVDGTAVEGGYFVTESIEVTSTGEAGKIPTHACIKGALCYCTGDSKFYQYDGTAWVEAQLGGSDITIEDTTSAATVGLAEDTSAFNDKMQAVCDATNANSYYLCNMTDAPKNETSINLTVVDTSTSNTPWHVASPNSGSYACWNVADLAKFDTTTFNINTRDSLDFFTLYTDTVDLFYELSRLQLWGFNSSNPTSFYFRELPATAYSVDNALGRITINNPAELATYLPSADDVYLKVQWSTATVDNSYSNYQDDEGQSYKESVFLYGSTRKSTSSLVYWNPEKNCLTTAPIEAPIEAVNEKFALQGGTRSQALSRNAFTYGHENISGGKGFRILGLSKNGTTCVIKLDTSLGYSDEIKVGDEYSVRLSSASYKKGKVKSVDTTTHDSKHFISVTVDNFVSSLEIDDGEYNSPELGYCKNNEKIDEYKDDKAPSLENYFMIVGKPEVGNIDVGFNAFISGEGNIATDRDAVSFGRENQSIGQYSFTEGRQNIAAYAAHAEGRLNNALGEMSHAEGYKTNVSGNYAHVEGASTVVTGAAAHAEGHKSQANGWYSHAEGNNTAANGTYSHAEGTETIAESEGAHAEGAKTHATGDASHAEGELTEANGFASHAEGYTVQANGDRSHAEGDYEPLASNKEIKYNGISYIMNGAYGTYSHREGRNTRTQGPGSHAEGDGSFAVGTVSHAEGGNTIAEGYCSHSEGAQTNAVGNNAHAEGQKTNAIGENSHAEGQETLAKGIGGAHAEGSKTKALGESSHAEGRETLANASFSHAEGCLTQALGLRSHAEGDKSAASFSKTLTGNGATVYGNATGHFSHREGRDTESYGQGSHAEGQRTTAYGEQAHAEGYSTEAIGASSHAEGSGTIALGKASHASGIGTKATADYQTVIGKYNATNDNALFIIGKGSSANALSNALTVDTSGNAVFAGTIKGTTLYEGGTALSAKYALKSEISTGSSGITVGTTAPSNTEGNDGDIYLWVED